MLESDNIKERIITLVKALKDARQSYYNANQYFIISDIEFDAMENELRKLDPDHPYFSDVGSEVDRKHIQKIKHKYPMLSMAKVNTIDGVNEFWQKMRKIVGEKYIPLIVTLKLDGNAATVYYKNGILQHIASRGDGKEGFIINKDFISNIPHELKDKTFTGEIRGETIIPVAFEQRGDVDGEPLLPLRNTVSGLLNRKEKSTVHKWIHFVAYDMFPHLVSKHKTFEDILINLKIYGFETVDYYIAHSTENVAKFFKEYENRLRHFAPYESDGLVIAVNDLHMQNIITQSDTLNDRHHHLYNIALKPKAESAQTKLIGIEWNVSQAGKIVPVGILEPVRIGDVMVSRVTLNNVRFIKINDIKINDIIEIARSNDVIPKFISREHTNDSIDISIDKCPECNGKLSLDKNEVHLMCTNKNCPGQKIAYFKHWFNVVGIENIGEAAIQNLCEISGFTSLYQLYELSKPELRILFSKACNLDPTTNTLKLILETFEMSRWQSELDVLGNYGIPGIGKKILTKIGVKTLDDLRIYKENPSFSTSDSKFIQNLHTWLNYKNDATFQEDNWHNLSMLVYILRPTMRDETTYYEHNKKFCITGGFTTDRKDIIKQIREKFNWDFSSTVTKDLYVLLCKREKGGISSKEAQAIKYNIPIIYFDSDTFDITKVHST